MRFVFNVFVDSITARKLISLTHIFFSLRCCVLEPGPVLTPIVPKAQDWCHDRVDVSTADPKTLSLMEAVLANIDKEFASAMQSCEEVAEVVKEIIFR